MENAHHRWSASQLLAYTEVSLIQATKRPTEALTARRIVQLLSQESRDWVCTLPHGPNESGRAIFMQQLYENEILVRDAERHTTSLGAWGNVVLGKYLEALIAQ